MVSDKIKDRLQKGYTEPVSSKTAVGRYSGKACGLYPVLAQQCADVASHARRTYQYEYSVAPITGGISLLSPALPSPPKKRGPDTCQ